MKTVFATMLVVLITAWILANPLEQATSDRGVSSAVQQPTRDFAWPPRLNSRYPDLKLIDQEGQVTRLSDFEGMIILVEPIGMPCKACQAFCGGHELGGFDGIPPQPGLPSMAKLAKTYGRFDYSDDRIVKIYLLLYDLDMRAPSPKDARDWADHFQLDRSRNEVVLAGLPSLISQESYEMIPGVQLIDQDFVLRLDSTGRSNQQHDLYRELLPAVRAMMDE